MDAGIIFDENISLNSCFVNTFMLTGQARTCFDNRNFYFDNFLYV